MKNAQLYSQATAAPTRKIAFGAGGAGASLIVTQKIAAVINVLMQEYATRLHELLSGVIDVETTIATLIPVVVYYTTAYITKEKVQ